MRESRTGQGRGEEKREGTWGGGGWGEGVKGYGLRRRESEAGGWM